jgi:hypothetical protein
VTESQWLKCTDPKKMLSFLQGKVGERKRRLFACACCRQVWNSLVLKSVRRGVEAAELYADGSVTDEELNAAYSAALRAFRRALERRVGDPASHTTLHLMALAVDAAYGHPGHPFQAGQVGEVVKDDSLKAVSLALLRCVVGNPFRSVTISPICLTPQVVALALATYDERELPAGTLDLARLAVLADALEEAGCTDADILGHLRGPGPHARGCWVVDLLLGKS